MLVLATGLATSHKIAIVVMAVIFIAFALTSSFVLPRRNPSYPGRGLGVFIGVCVVLFAAMIGTVTVFGVEGEAEAGQVQASTAHKGTIDVSETEFRIALPKQALGETTGGAVTFHVTNDGKIPHDLVIKGPQVNGAHTPLLQPGQSANLKVVLTTGSYDLYCSVPGHKAAGMDAKLSVG